MNSVIPKMSKNEFANVMDVEGVGDFMLSLVLMRIFKQPALQVSALLSYAF